MTAVDQIGPADRAFLEISQGLAREDSPSRILGVALTGAMRLAGADGGRAFFLDRELRHLYCADAHPKEGAANDRPADQAPLLDIENPAMSENPLVYCLRAGRPVRIDDIHRHSGFDCSLIAAWDRAAPPVAPPDGTTAAVVVPLRDHSAVAVGALLLLRRQKERAPARPAFAETEAAQLLRFTEHAATAVVAARLMMENTRLKAMVGRLPAPEVPDGTRRDDAVDPFAAIVGNSAAMREALTLARSVAPTDTSVLLLGETGTGKEVVARAIHDASSRAGRPFVAQNCAAIPETLLEAELFGWTRGAFSGADAARDGLFMRASGGTLLLDEIGDMPPGLQAKLLRVLQEQRVRPLGSVTEHRVDVRIIAATHRDLPRLVETGGFRADLYYRLAVFPLELPPLRRRVGDLALLVQHFLRACRARLDADVPDFALDALDALEAHDWPGNVRELRNVVERAALLARDRTAPLGVPPDLGLADVRSAGTRPAPAVGKGEGQDADIGAQWETWADLPLRDAVARFETAFIRHSLESAEGNQTVAARALGLPRRTLVDKIRRYGLDRV